MARFLWRNCRCDCGREGYRWVEIGSTGVPCDCGRQMEMQSGGQKRRACEEYQRVYDPRDDNVMIHNLDQAAKRCGLPGYERLPRR